MAQRLLATLEPRDDPRGAFQTVDRNLAAAGIAITSARRYLNFFTALVPLSFTKIDILTGAGAPVSVTAARLGVYTVAANGDCTLVARTANDATIAAAASTEYQKDLDTTGGFPASYQLTPGARYAAAFFVTAGTPPTILGFAIGSALAAAAPRLTGFDNSGAGADLNATITAANLANITSQYYLAGL